MPGHERAQGAETTGGGRRARARVTTTGRTKSAGAGEGASSRGPACARAPGLPALAAARTQPLRLPPSEWPPSASETLPGTSG